MQRRTKLAALATTVVVGLGVGTGIATATSDDSESPITGSELAKAEAAALEHTGGGRVNDTEVGDEESYYEVEVQLPDGKRVDVQLDENFRVVGTNADRHEDSRD